MTDGYAGSILRVDLSSGEVSKTPLPGELVDNYIGGRGFVAKLLYDELPPDTDPYSAENIFLAATGPLSGYFLPASGKVHFGTKSPATGGYADSNMGGHFGPTLKYAGYDVLVLTGRSATPSYVFIDDEQVEIRPAESYWGMGALSCEARLKKDLGEDFQILTIGPAGENRVRFACISHDFGRQAGRTGVGAVLGSKNIKAIAVKGTGSLPVYDVERAYAAGKDAYQKVFAKTGFKEWTPEGTAGITDWTNSVGVFPTRNFQTSFADHHKSINGKAILEQLKITDKGCFCCPTPCGKYGHTKTDLGAAYVEGPEYETIALFGGNCLLQTISEVAYANYLCDELGIDTISAGAVISWAIECLEKGILDTSQIGREIQFSDLGTVEFLLTRIARREGIGDLLAEGVKAASEKIGKGSEAFAIHVKGLEWTGYETRNAPSMMLAYMTADIGAHHNRAWVLGYDVAGAWTSVTDLISSGGDSEKMPKAKVRPECAQYVIDSQHTRPLFDALGIPRFYKEPIPSGPNEGYFLTKADLDILLDEYYRARGWDENGIPTRETLGRLGLDELAKQQD
ncbi:MAG: aldehyde ferredoxin oxidoreductase family protein [Deltaproteobacteria bacterium]